MSKENRLLTDLSQLKAFEDNKKIMVQKLKFLLGRVENIVGKGENASYQHYLFFPLMFFKCFLFQRW